MCCDSDSAQACSIIESHCLVFCGEFFGYNMLVNIVLVIVNAGMNALISVRNCGLKLVRGVAALRGKRTRVRETCLAMYTSMSLW